MELNRVPFFVFSDCVFLSCRSAYKLDVEAFNLVSADSFAAQVGLDDLYELIIDDVAECVVGGVVEMDVLECVYIEVHFVVGAQTVVVDAEHRHVGQNVVD